MALHIGLQAIAVRLALFGSSQSGLRIQSVCLARKTPASTPQPVGPAPQVISRRGSPALGRETRCCRWGSARAAEAAQAHRTAGVRAPQSFGTAALCACIQSRHTIGHCLAQ